MARTERADDVQLLIDIKPSAWEITEDQRQFIRDINLDSEWCNFYKLQLSLIKPREVIDVLIPEESQK